jgi:kinesin family protein 3/17
MQQEMAAKAEAALANEEQFSNVQQEVEMKTKKLKKLWAKFQEAETTLKEEREAFQVISGVSMLILSLFFKCLIH